MPRCWTLWLAPIALGGWGCDARPAEPNSQAAAVPASAPNLSGRAAPGSLTAGPVKQDFESWILACDNVRTCRAQPRMSIGAVTIRREAGPDGRVAVLLGGPQPSDGPVTANLRSIRVGGAPSPAPWRLVDEVATLEGEPALEFARALMRASSLSFRAGEPEPYEIPLAGLPAALRAMDAAQGHEDGEAAFATVGARPRAQVPPAPARPVIEVMRPASLPRLPAAFAARVRRAAPQAAECEAETRDLDEAHSLDAAEALVILECGHGLTNSNYLLLRVPRAAPARAVPIVLPSVPAADDGYEDVPGMYTNIEWDPQRRSLVSVVRSCMGGCGESVEWMFDGRDFRLVSFTFYEAGGVDTLDLYRAEVRRPR